MPVRPSKRLKSTNASLTCLFSKSPGTPSGCKAIPRNIGSRPMYLRKRKTATKKPLLATAKVSNDVVSCLNSSGLLGITNVCTARTNEAATINAPPTPNIPSPGKTKNSIRMKTIPIKKSKISNTVALPSKYCLQKNSIQQIADKKPGTPNPGLENSVERKKIAPNNTSQAIWGEANRRASLSTQRSVSVGSSKSGSSVS